MPDVSKLQVAMYQAASLVHWPARERALLTAFAELKLVGKGGRIVDIGCGPGLLAGVLVPRGFTYLGLDPDIESISQARTVYKSAGSAAEFCVAAASDVSSLILSSDIVVMNGVCHHLSDENLSTVFKLLQVCRGLFILDHQLDDRTSRPNRILQRADKGRFVRASTVFERLPGYQTLYSQIFSIPSPVFPMWRYFCNFYIPSEAKQ